MLLFIGVVALLFIGTSKIDEATEKLGQCTSYDAIYTTWNEYKDDLGDDENWKLNVLEKLKGISSLTQDQQDSANKWLGLPKALNLVIVPDLSSRIGISGQVETDKELLNYLWSCFDAHVRAQANSGNSIQVNNRIIVDVTTESQERMQQTLDDLYIDLSDKGDASLTTLKNKKVEFAGYIDELYRLAKIKNRGADYVQYINGSLKSSHRQSNWYNKVDNVLVIITDGYVELSSGEKGGIITRYTGEVQQRDRVIQEMKGPIPFSQILKKNGIQIPVDKNVNLNDWKILILEARYRNERYDDFKIMKQAWTDWLKAESCKVDQEFLFQPHETQIQKAYNAISTFLNVKPNSTITENTEPNNINTVINTTTDHSKKYDDLLAEAEQAVTTDDFDKGKLLLRKAAQLKQTADLSTSSKAEVLYQKYVSFADKAYQTFLETKTAGLGSIPMHYYELAALIKPGNEIQRKLEACRTNL